MSQGKTRDRANDKPVGQLEPVKDPSIPNSTPPAKRPSKSATKDHTYRHQAFANSGYVPDYDWANHQLTAEIAICAVYVLTGDADLGYALIYPKREERVARKQAPSILAAHEDLINLLETHRKRPKNTPVETIAEQALVSIIESPNSTASERHKAVETWTKYFKAKDIDNGQGQQDNSDLLDVLKELRADGQSEG